VWVVSSFAQDATDGVFFKTLQGEVTRWLQRDSVLLSRWVTMSGAEGLGNGWADLVWVRLEG